MTNRLAEETSPYLIQHAENPVDWYPWGEEALNLAKAQNKPILLSIGYSACHWCHVMAHESFEDDATAAVMNKYCINIKVDREERPDIDQIYQTAHSMLSHRSGGWPLTVFLTPNQEPYFTGTYFPKTARYQLPGFSELIPRVAAYYHERKDDLAVQNHQLAQALARTIPAANTMVTANAHTIQQAFEQIKAGYDFENGGFGSAPKFPNPADVTLLLHQAKAGNQQAEAMALQMLSAMAEGGIYDRLGGGFCRYSVDERWNIPHFEKMLYDNGQLLCLYTDGWQLTQNVDDKNRYARVVDETVSWLIREMRAPQGAFYSSLDADSLDVNGHSAEGAFYVWQLSEIKTLLTPEEFVVVSRCYGFERAPNFEDPHTQTVAWHPYLAVEPDEAETELLNAARQKMFLAREKRTHPGRDDKILTSWNALVIQGLARAGRVFGRKDWLHLAQEAVDYIREKLWVDGRLLATCKNDRAHLNAYLDDYAFLLNAMIELMQAEYRSCDLQFAEALAEALLEDFEAEDGGFYFTAHHHETLIHRPKQAYDNATPNGNGIAAIALQRLGHILGEIRYLQSAERTLQAFDQLLNRNPAACASLMQALAEYLTPTSIVIVRGPSEQLATWRDEIRQHYKPHHLFFFLDETVSTLPESLNRNISDDVNAWICEGVKCSQRIVGLPGLLSQLG